MKVRQIIFAASEVTVKDAITEPGVYAVRLTGVYQTNSHLKNNGERVDNIKSDGFVDANPQLRFEFTIVSGKHSGMKFNRHRQSLVGYVSYPDLEDEDKTIIQEYLWKEYKSKPSVKEKSYCEYIDEINAMRSLYDENEKIMEEDDFCPSVSTGWHRILSVKNTVHSRNMLKEQLLPTGLLIEQGNNTYLIPEFNELHKMCVSGKSRIFYIELYQDGDNLKLKRTFSTEDVAKEANKEEDEESSRVSRRKVKA